MTLAKAISGQHVVMVHISSPTPALLDLARASCSFGLGEPTAELNFLNQTGHDGRGTGLTSVIGVLWSQVLM